MNADSTVKFKVERDVFADAVTWAAKNLPQRPVIPVLTGVLVTADNDGTVRFAFYDLSLIHI